MKNVFKKLFGQRGFSLPEILIGVGLMGGMSLLVTQVVKQTDQVKKSSETNTNSFAAFYEIQSLFKDKAACAVNLQGKTVSGGPLGLTTVMNAKGILRYEVGKSYDGGSITLTGLSLTRNPTETLVNVTIQKTGNKKANGLNDTSMTKSIAINAEYDGAGRILSCQSDVANHVDTVMIDTLRTICSGMNLEFDAAKKRCFAKPQMGLALSRMCPNGESVVSYQLPSGEYTMTCQDSLGMQGTCNENQLLRKNSSGSFSCVDMTCPGTAVFQGLDSNGLPKCLTCSSGQMIVFDNGQATCKRPSCMNSSGGSSQLYMAGIDSNGDAICNKLVDDSASNCNGGKLIVKPDGSISYDCCVPDCSASATQCIGTNYPSPNNCGQCTGSQPVSCPDASNYCSGTSYAGTCGSCSGTRLPTNGTWGPWVASAEFRDKAGASCDCATSKMPQQRKYTRTCSVPACGGATCTGDAEEWRDEGAGASCTPTSCGLHYFLTATAYNGNLGGQAGADAKCNSDVNRKPGITYVANLGDHCNEWVTATGGYGVSGCRFPYTGPWMNETLGDEKLTKTGNYWSLSYTTYDYNKTFWQAYKFNIISGPKTNCNNWSTSGACPAGTTSNICAVRMQLGGTVGNTNYSGYIQACSETHYIMCMQTLASANCTRVDGGWSAWTPWDTSSCSGSGTQYKFRRRGCDSPFPACGGSVCAGADSYYGETERAVCP